MNTIQEMMNIINEQFQTVINDDPEYYAGTKIILSNEQQFIKLKDRDTNAIYIVVKFLSGPLNYMQNLVPVNFNVMGQGNKIELSQRLLLEYAQTFNLSREREFYDTDDSTTPPTVLHTYIIKQVYNHPQVMSNFNETWNEFRSLFFMAGTFLIGKDSLPIQSITYYATESDMQSGQKGEDIQIVSATWDFSIQLDSQAFYGTDSITVSKSKQGTLVMNIACYFVNNDLCKMIRAMAFRNKTKAPNGIKTVFYLKVTFADQESESVTCYLASANTIQNIGEFPLISMTFTN